MSTLRITQTALPDGEHRVQLDLTGDGVAQSAFAQFPFTLSDQDREDLRWYLEDYLQYPDRPGPSDRRPGRAADARRSAASCTRSYSAATAASRRLWARLANPSFAGMRVEVASEVDADAVLPWELLRDPARATPTWRSHAGHVRAGATPDRPASASDLSCRGGETIRVLLVICRPGGRPDVPFRSVASHLVRLSADSSRGLRARRAAPADLQRGSPEVLRRPGDATCAVEPRHRRERAPRGGPRLADAVAVVRQALRAAVARPPRARTATCCSRTPRPRTTSSYVDGPAAGQPAGRDPACRCWCSTPASSAHADAHASPHRRRGRLADVHDPGAGLRVAGPGGGGRGRGRGGGHALQRLRRHRRPVHRRPVRRAARTACRSAAAVAVGPQAAGRPAQPGDRLRAPARCRTGSSQWSTRRSR